MHSSRRREQLKLILHSLWTLGIKVQPAYIAKVTIKDFNIVVNDFKSFQLVIFCIHTHAEIQTRISIPTNSPHCLANSDGWIQNTMHHKVLQACRMWRGNDPLHYDPYKRKTFYVRKAIENLCEYEDQLIGFDMSAYIFSAPFKFNSRFWT